MKGHHLYKIYVWKQADIINLKSYIFDAVKIFIDVNTITAKINSLLEYFSNMCQELIDVHVHVSSKMTSDRYSHDLD